jgi:hypothetical protein
VGRCLLPFVDDHRYQPGFIDLTNGKKFVVVTCALLYLQGFFFSKLVPSMIFKTRYLAQPYTG